MADAHNSTTEWVIRTLSDQLSQVFETMAGESPLIESSQPDPPDSTAALTYWEVPFNPFNNCSAFVAVEKSGWHYLGDKILSGAGLEGSDEQTILDTFKETLDQAFSGLAREMTLKIGKEVTAGSGRIVPPSAPPLTWVRLELVFSDNRPASMRIGISAELERLIEKRQETPAKSGGNSHAAAAGAGFAAVAVAEPSHTMELLLDVELPISVSFGRAHLPLKDVMKLTTGSIVELNRTVSEPVDIIVNNCVIARGEVVVVEGNFGVKIHEVISRQERLRTLY